MAIDRIQTYAARRMIKENTKYSASIIPITMKIVAKIDNIIIFSFFT